MWTLDGDTRRRYVHGMTRLSVWYVHHLFLQGEIGSEDLAQALCKRVNIYRLTDVWDGRDGADDGSGSPAWKEHADQIASFIRTATSEASAEPEEKTLALLRSTLEDRLPKDVGPPPVRPFECWTYDLGWAGMADRPGLLGKLTNFSHMTAVLRRTVGLAEPPPRDGVLHIMNVVVPGSPFDDMQRLAETLHGLIADIRSRHPEVRELWCNTWLNEHPKFRELMPEIWFKNGTVAPPGNFRNWWGQFARRDGDFNGSLAKRFRANGGVFPFRAVQCHAGLEVIDAHLRSRFGL